MIETIFFTCWMIVMADGSVHCYCENEPPPVIERVERGPIRQDPVSRLSLKESAGDN